MTGVAMDTIEKPLADLGVACSEYKDKRIMSGRLRKSCGFQIMRYPFLPFLEVPRKSC